MPTSGQVLVYHDLLGFTRHPHHAKVTPKFSKQYADVGAVVGDALRAFATSARRVVPGSEALAVPTGRRGRGESETRRWTLRPMGPRRAVEDAMDGETRASKCGAPQEEPPVTCTSDYLWYYFLKVLSLSMTPFARAKKKKNGSSNAASGAAALVTSDERVVSASLNSASSAASRSRSASSP